jgi:hypothetical protein
MVSHTQPPLPKHSRFHPYGITREGFRVGSICTYRLVIDSAPRGNQNRPEITVKDLANDNRESDGEGARVTLPVASILLGFLFAGFWWTLNRELTFKVEERNSVLVPSWFAMASSY